MKDPHLPLAGTDHPGTSQGAALRRSNALCKKPECVLCYVLYLESYSVVLTDFVLRSALSSMTFSDFNYKFFI